MSQPSSLTKPAAEQRDRGSERDATSYSGDAVYMLSPSTVINVTGTYHSFIDASAFASSVEGLGR